MYEIKFHHSIEIQITTEIPTIFCLLACSEPPPIKANTSPLSNQLSRWLVYETRLKCSKNVVGKGNQIIDINSLKLFCVPKKKKYEKQKKNESILIPYAVKGRRMRCASQNHDWHEIRTVIFDTLIRLSWYKLYTLYAIHKQCGSNRYRYTIYL